MIYSKMEIDEIIDKAKKMHWKTIKNEDGVIIRRKYKEGVREIELKRVEEVYEVL